MNCKMIPSLLVVITFVLLAFTDLTGLPLARAQTGGGYDLTWSSVDGGGYMFSAGGGYSLGGIIGQPDASAALAGGGFTLVGGFWHDWGAQFEVFLPLIVR